MTSKPNRPNSEPGEPPLRDLSQLLAEFGIKPTSAGKDQPARSPASGTAADGHRAKPATAKFDSGNGPAAGGITSWLPKRHVPEAARGDSQLIALFDRVEALLGATKASDAPWFPRAPESLAETGLTVNDVERLILKFMLSKGAATGRAVAQQIRLPFAVVEPILRDLQYDLLLTFVSSAEMGDREYSITEMGSERARRYVDECTYYGAAPVSLRDYLKAMDIQSIGKQQVTEQNLRDAFSDLLLGPELLESLGPAINSGRGMLLFGAPGNGKTSIAERITKCFGSTIWIPRALGIDGDLIRLYDPGLHEEAPFETLDGLSDSSDLDQRWIRIVRPTVIAGGELTMEELEVCQNHQTKVCEAPLQLKSNCGTLVIDDFGRQRMPVSELLNRWIVPLEKRYDFLTLPSGKKIQVPFDQLIIFSTNLEPGDLVDDAFLRRIPYKIRVPDPTEAEFREILRRLSPRMGFQYDESAVDHLIQQHYHRVKRPFHACQPRDLLQQVRNYCTYKQISRKLTVEAFDFAVRNYFSVL